jgi:hypothetical protein
MREIWRRVGAVMLIGYGLLGIVIFPIEVALGDDAAFHLAMIPLAIGSGLSGWLLWRGDERRRVGGVLLLSVGAFALLTAMGELAAREDTLVHLLMGELRVGFPALACGGLLWTGRAGRQIVAALVFLWAASFTIQAVAYADEPLTTVVLVVRAGIPAFLCAWLLWHGGELRQLAAVLLVSWPVSYLIYALRRDSLENAIGEIVITVPTALVGCLLWRERRVPATACGAAPAQALDARDGP